MIKVLARGEPKGQGPLVRRKGAGFRSVGSVALVAFLLAGCERSPQPAEAAREVTSSWGGFHVEYRPRPDPIPLNELFGLSVRVYEGSDRARPAADATVTVDARMPEHNHGMTLEPRVVSEGEGRFRVEGLLFHMPGRWELYVDITRGTEMERATFEVILE